MGLGITKVDIDSLGMANVKNTIGFWRESGSNLALGSTKMFLKI